MITSRDNERLKLVRKLHDRRWRDKLGLYVAEGEDLVDAARAAGLEPVDLLAAGETFSPATSSSTGSSERAASTRSSPSATSSPSLSRQRRSWSLRTSLSRSLSREVIRSGF